VVVVEGDTDTLEPVRLPGFQVYVVAPLAPREAEVPLQMVVLVALTVTFGVAVTVTVVMCVAVQPEEVPVTVYTAVEDGFTLTEAVPCPPGAQE
jgi:hypothetical protein